MASHLTGGYEEKYLNESNKENGGEVGVGEGVRTAQCSSSGLELVFQNS